MQNNYDYTKHIALLEAELETLYSFISQSKEATDAGRGESSTAWQAKWERYLEVLNMHELLCAKAGASLHSDDSLFVRG